MYSGVPISAPGRVTELPAPSSCLARPKSLILGTKDFTAEDAEDAEEDREGRAGTGDLPGFLSLSFSASSASSAVDVLSRCRRMLPGLRSRWTTPCSWA